MPPDDDFWDDLLAHLHEQVLLPVVGPQAVTVVDGGRRLPVSALIAERLARRQGLEPAVARAGLDAVVRAVLHAQGRDRQDRLYRIVNDLLAELDPAPPAAQTEGLPAAEAGTATATGAEADGGGTAERIEPALLSLFCRGLNEQRKRLGLARFDDALLDTAKQGILSDYYDSCFTGMPESVRRFVASELITEKGYRNSVAKDDATPAHLSDEQLAHLIDRRLLRVEERYGVLRIELTHDLLTRVVREHRDRLRQEAAEARRASEAAAAAAAERAALQAEMQRREERLQAERLGEARQAQRTFQRLSIVLAGVLVLAVAMAVTAWRQRDAVLEAQQTESKLRQVAEQQIVVAEQQRQVAEARLQRITTGLDLKRAVLAGDREQIRRYLASRPAAGPEWRPDFRATARPYGYRQGGKEIYAFTIAPTADTAAKMQQRVVTVTFRLDHPSFRNPLLVTGPERQFSASYDGWGCMGSVLALVEYLDPDRAPELIDFDMCAALGW